MSLLKDFLIENSDVNEKEVEVTVSKRFKDKDGNILKFKIKPVSSAEFSSYQKQASKMELIGKKKSVTMDSKKFNNLVCINHCVDPDFRDAELIKKLAVQSAEEALSKVLLAGEVIDLAEKISDISGFNADINEEIEEAKN